MNTTEPRISDEDVARRAYEIWESRGCPPGDGAADWNEALEELFAAQLDQMDPSEEPAKGIRVWWTRVRRKIAGRNG
ncbi:MAG: DUF2934 domain-containing protein [Planctomycetes bacterium]|nr:DUF2934 domain-containing protein [Planctomycetota bacterium]